MHFAASSDNVKQAFMNAADSIVAPTSANSKTKKGLFNIPRDSNPQYRNYNKKRGRTFKNRSEEEIRGELNYPKRTQLEEGDYDPFFGYTRTGAKIAAHQKPHNLKGKSPKHKVQYYTPGVKKKITQEDWQNQQKAAFNRHRGQKKHTPDAQRLASRRVEFAPEGKKSKSHNS